MQLHGLTGVLLLNGALLVPPGVARSEQTPNAVDLGGSLVVGDTVIPIEEIERFLLYGPLRAELRHRETEAWRLWIDRDPAAESFICGLPVSYFDHGFLSKEALADYVRLFESYWSSVEEKIADREDGSLPRLLQDQLERSGLERSLARVDVDVLLCSAVDFPALRWKPGGWEAAEREAEELMKLATSGEADWDELMRTRSEFWDPPLTQRFGGPGHRFNHGELGPLTSADLRDRMHESDYTHFLNGELWTDEVFFRAPVGVVVGPYRCRWGYCLVKVESRTPPTHPLDPTRELDRNLVRLDWVRRSFVSYAHEALAAVRAPR